MDKKHCKTQGFFNTIKTTKYILDSIRQCKKGKVYLSINFVMALFNAVYPLVFTIIPGLIINELMNDRRINRLVMYVILLTVVPMVIHFFQSFLNKLTKKMSLSINLDISKRFFEHYTSMDFESVENPEIGIMQERAQMTLDNSLTTANYVCNLIKAIVSLIAISSVVSILNPLLVVLIIVVTLINSKFTRIANAKMYRVEKEMSRAKRYRDSASHMLSMITYAKEIRLFDLKSYLISHYEGAVLKYNGLNLKKVNIGMGPNLFAAITSFIQQSIVYAYLLLRVLKYNLPVGDMTIYLSATSQLSGALNAVFGSYSSLVKESLNIRDTIEFMNMPHRQKNCGTKQPYFTANSLIEFKDVSFKYPGSDSYAIKNLSIKIKANEKLCIVGANGSGKSTFIKLLARLYYPTEGEILLNGINIYEYQYDEYLRLFSPVFQDFCGYFMSLSENIVLSKKYNKSKLDDICQRSGLMSLINKLNKGYDTQIGKWIDENGIQPSGGEFQKIAIARAIYNNAPICLLDEPTAALDPLIEYEIYKEFNEMTINKCAILISHRLSAVQLADTIAVFDDGRVAEYGTHAELYAKGGIYTEMFDKQAQFYRDEVPATQNAQG